MLNLEGHDEVVRGFSTVLRDGNLHHAYLLVGPAHVGKLTLATQLAQAVNCLRSDVAPCGECVSCVKIAAGGHADVRVISVDAEAAEGPRTVIGIDAVRELIGSAHLRPYEGRCRVFIFNEADRMTTDAANALLKVLEEPPADVLLLLLSANEDAVLPTVKSRCQRVELHPLSTDRVAGVLSDKHGVAPEQADVIARLSRGCIGWAIEAAHDPSLLAGIHQRQERIVDVIDDGVEGKFAYAEELARRYQRDRAAGRDELFLWLRWLRDILLFQQDEGASIVNVNWRDTIHRQANALTPADTVRWLRLLNDTLETLDRNANARLALEVMMLEAPALH